MTQIRAGSRRRLSPRAVAALSETATAWVLMAIAGLMVSRGDQPSRVVGAVIFAVAVVVAMLPWRYLSRWWLRPVMAFIAALPNAFVAASLLLMLLLAI